MTYTLIIALNLSLSILAILVVAGCTAVAHTLRAEAPLDAGWDDWNAPLSLELAVQHGSPEQVEPEPAPYAVAA